MKIAHAIASAKVRKFDSPDRSSWRSSTSAARSLIFISIGNRVRFCNLPLTERPRMPSLSSCACKEAHTRAGGSTTAGNSWAAETMLVRSATKLWAPATFTDLRAYRFPQRRTTIECDLRFLTSHCPSLHRPGIRSPSRSTLNLAAGFHSRRGGLGPPAPPKQRDLSASGCCSCGSGDLVEGGIGNLIGLYLRSSVNHLRQSLRHFGVSSAVVGFRVVCQVPQTDAECFLSSRCDKSDFVPESVLFSKQGKDFPFQSLGELGNAALQMHGDFACKHVNLLGWLAKGDSDNLL